MAPQVFDWNQYLTLAQELGRRAEEAALRSSISRAYYCVYNLALRRAERNGFVPQRSESSHKQLWQLFSKSPDGECIALGQIASRLKQKRERADYEAGYPRIAEEVPQVLKDAQNFAARLGRLAARLPNPTSMRQ